MTPSRTASEMPATWQGCYGTRWGDFIVPEAYQHPAKFARGLVERIFRHGLDRGYWQRGDLIGDPFAGVALGGLVAAYNGLRWLGVEIEAKFVEIARNNILHHADRLQALSAERPMIVHDDSRRFAQLVGITDTLSAVITSPPWGSNTEGGVGKLRSMEPDAAVEMLAAGGGHTSTPEARRAQLERDKGRDLGDSPGQIGRLSAGEIDAVVTSPPWEKNIRGGLRPGMDVETIGHGAGKVARPKSDRRQAASEADKTYGDTEGQIGKTTGETYWQAMDLVYRQCFAALRPGGHMAVVVKDYVKDKGIVPLCGQTLQVLIHIGFEVVERIRASLVKETRTAGLFCEMVRRVERKSFFRRLAEKRGSPRIDWEEVLIVRRPKGPLR